MFLLAISRYFGGSIGELAHLLGLGMKVGVRAGLRGESSGKREEVVEITADISSNTAA